MQVKPSQVASAALIFSINLCQSDIAQHLGLKKISNLNLNSLYFENVMNIEMDGVKQIATNINCPLRVWNAYVQTLTSVNVETDVRPAYTVLSNIVN